MFAKTQSGRRRAALSIGIAAIAMFGMSAPAWAATSTTTQVVSLKPTSVVGETVTFTATVSPSAATGTMTFKDGVSGPTIGSCLLSGGSCAIGYAGLAVGTHTIVATYSGDGTYSASSDSITQVVSASASLTVAVTSNVNPSALGQLVTFTATPSVDVAATVTFRDGATLLGSGVLSGNVWRFSTASLTAGAHNITATLVRTSDSYTVTSPIYVQNVVTSASTVSLTSSLNPSALGQSVTFSATVSPSAATGYVDFYDGSQLIGRDTSENIYGQWQVATSGLSLGTHSITAVFTSTNGYAQGVSAPLAQVVAQYTVTTVLTSDRNPSSYGERVTFTATVSPTAATGLITMYDGSTSLGSCLISLGSCSLATSTLTVGTHNVTAQFTGTPTYVGGTSNTVTQVVRLETPTVILTANPNPVQFGQPLTLSVRLSKSDATGTVSFVDGSTPLGSCTLASGACSISVSTLSIGVHTLAARYSGSASYNAADSNLIAQTVLRLPTALELTSSGNPVQAGQYLSLTAKVTPRDADGKVTFFDGGTAIGTCTLYLGSCSLSTTTLAAGPHSLSAQYAGNASYLGSDSNVVAQTISRIPTSIAVWSSPNPQTRGFPVTFTAQIAPYAATGTVTFLSGSDVIGTCTLNQGLCTMTTSTLAYRLHSVTARFDGDTNYLPATSVAYMQYIEAFNRTVTVTGGVVKLVKLNMGPAFAGKVVKVEYRNPGSTYRLLKVVALDTMGKASISTRLVQRYANVRVMLDDVSLKLVRVA